MIGFCDYRSTAPMADIASQLEEILSELNQVSDPTLRDRMLATLRLLMIEADRLAWLERLKVTVGGEA